MLARYVFGGVCVSMALLSGCGAGTGNNDASEASGIAIRNKVDIHSMNDAIDHSVLIQATYNPIFSEIELVVCIPRPRRAPTEASGKFVFTLEEDGLQLVSTTIGSKIVQEKFEMFSVQLQPDFLEKVRLYFFYMDADEFQAAGALKVVYEIFFDEMAPEIIRMEVDLDAPKDPFRPRRELPCAD